MPEPTARRRTYTSYLDMKRRCTNPAADCYKNYGGRGISVCQRWLNSFDDFLSDMGFRPVGLRIERIDNDGNYEPSNCRWATQAEQSRNRRGCIHIEHGGRRLTLEEWSREAGIPTETLRRRYGRGKRGDALFAAPSKKHSVAGRRGLTIRYARDSA